MLERAVTLCASGTIAESDLTFRPGRATEPAVVAAATGLGDQIDDVQRQAIVEDLLGTTASMATTALVSMIVGAGRARQLSDISRAVGVKVAADDNKQLAEVRSAVPLSDDQIARLRVALASSIGSEVEVRVIVDPSVVGGIVTQIGDTVIDGSVRQKLTKMRESFS